MPVAVVADGLAKPSMWITRDAASMRFERERAGGWPEAEIEAHQSSMRAVFEALPGPGYFVRVSGMFHLNFTDAHKTSLRTASLPLESDRSYRRAAGARNHQRLLAGLL